MLRPALLMLSLLASLPAVEPWRPLLLPSGAGPLLLPGNWRERAGPGFSVIAPDGRIILAAAEEAVDARERTAWEESVVADLHRLGSLLEITDHRRLTYGGRSWLRLRVAMSIGRTRIEQAHWLGQVDGRRWSCIASTPTAEELDRALPVLEAVVASIGATAARIGR